MGLLDLILGKENPVSQWADTNQNFLGGVGAGLGAGTNFGQSLALAAQYGAAGKPADRLAAKDLAAQQKEQQQLNQTIQWLHQSGNDDLVPLVQGGQAGVALTEAIRRQKGEDPQYFNVGNGTIVEAQNGKATPIYGGGEGGGTPDAFGGTALEAQAWNIVLKGQKNPQLQETPEYQTALSIVSQPKTQLVAGPDGNMVQVQQSPQLPAFLTHQPAPVPQQAAPPLAQGPLAQGAPDVGLSPAIGAPAPTGTPGLTATPIPGTGKNALTEVQSKDVYFANNADGAIPILDTIGSKLTSLGGYVAGKGGALGNYLKSDEYQQAEQAGRVFINALLRKESGAAITKQEDETYGNTFLPKPGDKPGVLAQKAAARKRAVEGLKAGLPPQAILALGKTEGNEPTLSQKPPVASKTINGVTYVQDANGDWFEQ